MPGLPARRCTRSPATTGPDCRYAFRPSYTTIPSWITQPIVYTYLHRWRQDLLTPFLGQTAYSGRFSTGKTRFVLPLCNGFYRWTPEQQTIFAAVLEEVIRDEQRDSPAVFMAINQLAALPAFRAHTDCPAR